MKKTAAGRRTARRFKAALWSALLAACLAGCAAPAEARDSGAAAGGSLVALSEDGGEDREASRTELFLPYEPFGLRYDAEKDELRFDGQLVRWFEDYYPLSEDGAQAGNDFFNEDGVVDVYAVRDRSELARCADGSYDPSGTLVGVEAFSEEAFAARDVEAIRNPAPVTAVAGEGSKEELNAIAEGYAPFGVTYDAEEDQWYFNGEKVCFFRDVLTSNGKSLTGGGFRGAMRILSSAEGTVRIETVRDFTRPDFQGYGTLMDIQIIEDA